jgi:hypothetical protein
MLQAVSLSLIMNENTADKANRIIIALHVANYVGFLTRAVLFL